MKYFPCLFSTFHKYSGICERNKIVKSIQLAQVYLHFCFALSISIITALNVTAV